MVCLLLAWPCFGIVRVICSSKILALTIPKVKTLFRGCLARCFSTFCELRLLYWTTDTNTDIDLTRHRASTSMYSLTFCVRFLLPERHQRKPAVQAAAVMLRTPPVDGQSPASQPRPLPICGAQFWERPRHPPVTCQQRVHRLQIRPIVPSKCYFVGTK